MPHALTDDQELARVHCCQEPIIKTAQKNQHFLKCSLVMGNETWCFQYDPQTKCPSVKCDFIKIKKFKIKTMLIIFYESNGVIHNVFVSQGHRITDDYYLNVMECF